MKIYFTIMALAIISASSLFGQETADQVKYRRSSLHMILIESETFPNKGLVMNSWSNYPFPDKYNSHSVDIKSMNPANYKITDADRKANEKTKSKMGALAAKGSSSAASSASGATGGAVDNEAKEMPIKLEKFITETDLARKMVANWFNVSPDGKMDTKLVQERGFYNASEMDAALASGQAKGLASLGDAGEELISKTFVTFSKLNFVPNEHSAKLIRDAAIANAQSIKIPAAKEAAVEAAKLAYEKGKEGYSVWTNTWLYQLEWNDTIANSFWALWNKKEAFNNTDIFKLKYVGKESSQSLVTLSLKKGAGNRTEEQIIDLATVRNIDNVFANLQKEYDVFKPITPITSSVPITAKIGLKEGLQSGDKFDVLEMTWDEKAGKTVWSKVGTCSLAKNTPIWDNRYTAGTNQAQQKDEDGTPINATTFKGSKKIKVGMLLKQVK
jgi:hypothetical protein